MARPPDRAGDTPRRAAAGERARAADDRRWRNARHNPERNQGHRLLRRLYASKQRDRARTAQVRRGRHTR